MTILEYNDIKKEKRKKIKGNSFHDKKEKKNA